MERYYLDHNANSPLAPAVRARLRAFLDDPLTNPGGVHWHGQRSKAVIERARRTVLAQLGRTDGRVVFTSGATEATNLWVNSLPAGASVATTPLEHAATLQALQRRADLQLSWLEVDSFGRLLTESVARYLTAHPRGWVSMSAANNELGNVYPIAAVAEMAAASGGKVHVDAAQVFGRLPWEAPVGVCAATLSAHKAGGPMGVGALWYSADVALQPLLVGGAQERGSRAGTEDVYAIAGFLALLESPRHQEWQALGQVRNDLQTGLQERLGVQVLGDPDHRLPNTLNVAFPGRDSEETVMALDLEQVSVAAGSACTAGSMEISHVIAALRLPDSVSRSAVRISLGPEHVGMDVEALLERITEALA
jgi:cysteine desulfurase